MQSFERKKVRVECGVAAVFDRERLRIGLVQHRLRLVRVARDDVGR